MANIFRPESNIQGFRKQGFVFALTIAICVAVSAISFGETREWKGPANGLWSEPTNWSPEGVLASGDVLKFTDEGAYPSFNDSEGFNCNLWFANTTKSVELTGGKIKIQQLVELDSITKCAVCARYATAPVTIRNDVEITAQQAKTIGSASADYPVAFAGTQKGGMQFGGYLCFNKAVDWTGVYVDQTTPCNANIFLNAQTNKFSSIRVYNNATIHCGCDEAISSARSQNLVVGDGANKNATVNLHGFNQSVQQLSGSSNASYKFLVTSDSPAVLRVDSTSAATVSHVVFEGGAGFELNAVDAESMFAFARTSSTTGMLAATRGVLTLNAKWESARTVKIGDCGRLVVALTDGIGAQAAATVEEGGILEISENCSVTIRKLVLPEIGEVDSGEWGSEESGAEHTSTALAGRGKIYVVAEKSSATWSGDDANDAVSAVSNWRVGGGAPESVNVTGGGLLATFAAAGSHATLDRAASFDGIVFDTSAFEFRTGAYDVLTLGGSGLTAADNATARTLTFEPTVKVNADQTWQVGAENSVVLNGGLSGAGAITKTGAGAVTLNADSTATGLFTIPGGNGTLIINVNRVSFPIDASGGSQKANPVSIVTDGTTVFERLIKYRSDLPVINYQNVVEYAGGFSGQAAFRLGSSAGKIRFTGGNVSLGGSYCDAGSANDFMEFAVSNVTTGSSNLMYYNGSGLSRKTLRCSVPYALSYNFNISMGRTGGTANNQDNVTLDISGGDQGISRLKFLQPSYTGNDYQKVVSTGDNVLHVREIQGPDATTHNLYAVFQGGAGFACETAAEATNVIFAPNTSTGRVCVASGTLTFGENGSWANASKLVVSGGRLVLPRKDIVTNRAVDIEIAGDGVVELAAGVRLKARSVKLGDKTYEDGTFGAPGSGATHESTAFAGKGIVTLKLGLVLLLR